MTAFRHLFLLFCYAGLAASAAVYLPQWVPRVDGTLALLASAVVFVAGGLLHENYARMGRDGRLAQMLNFQRRATAELEEELNWTRREVRAVREALETVARSQNDAEGGQAAGEVVAELKMLKSLLARIADSRPAKAGAAAKPAPAAKQPKAKPAPAPLPVGGAVPALGPDHEETLRLIREAIRDDRVQLALQPIVGLPQRKHRAYECFSRLIAADGSVLLPEQYIAVAEQAGLITAIDNMLLFRCIQLVRRIQGSNQDVDFFCNISPHTLADEEFFGDFVDFLESNKELASNLVFEFAQADAASHGKEQARYLDRLAALGCRFSLDQVQNLQFDAERLARRNVRFIKIDAKLLHGADPDASLRAFQKLKSAFAAHRIAIIVEKIEDEQTLLELLDYGLDIGQGYLFGEPRPAKYGG